MNKQNRDCEQRPWLRFYVVYDNDLSIQSALLNDPRSINAANNATIVLDRMVRNGRRGWIARQLKRL